MLLSNNFAIVNNNNNNLSRIDFTNYLQIEQ